MISTAEFARPTDTNAYGVGDIISNSTSAGAALRFDVQALLTFASLLKSTNSTSMAVFKMALYAADPGVVNDNVAWDLTYANRAGYISTITFATTAAVGSIAGAELTPSPSLSLPPVLYGVLLAGTGVALGNGETFSVRLSSRAR